MKLKIIAIIIGFISTSSICFASNEIIIEPSNEKKVSYNKHESFNVDKSGLTLNNIEAKADYIINEVINGPSSLLEGNIDVKGQTAHVVIANPNGIICDNCSFSNTLSETLVTGKPIIEQGELIGYHLENHISFHDPRYYNESIKENFGRIILRSDKHKFNMAFNQINIISNNINLEKGFISSRGNIVIDTGVIRSYLNKNKSYPLINGMRTLEAAYEVRRQITLGNKNNTTLSQGLFSLNRVIINADNTTLDNYGIIRANNKSKKSILFNLSNTKFNNYHYISTQGLTLNLKGYSTFTNKKDGFIIQSLGNRIDRRRGVTLKDTAVPMNNLTIALSHNGQFINEGVYKTIRLYTQDKKIDRIDNHNAVLNSYDKLLKIK
ncbi:filamentous hemagglutinin N-terminal domain-containing protein [Proteus alimentorum]|uniref:Filamentous hemagglutinin N-terminal domain-containing protein n=1 Tax=Proteus alimentorum TaxID=1973495 RepID=A0ABS0IV39_9GAMM|nr:filamentous hemagglutinin N-terminal domain-containing protein [Proteus alimentorum]MBG2875247.1 filamentous hemagglutinin N-terminal domain-containing protein [Proteus alimentorum]MBG2879884.1 filamentous hemagglutinin N-terminal domain-containing protein [Proteus alimentorum]